MAAGTGLVEGLMFIGAHVSIAGEAWNAPERAAAIGQSLSPAVIHGTLITVDMPATLQRSTVHSHRVVPRSRRRVCVSVQGYGHTYRYAISKRAFENLVEDLEALSSPKYLASIRRARRDVARGRVYTLDEVKRGLNIR